ncbi:MAG: hypothetical protein OYK82_06970 [Gammaproteobacteria bacterium]|nr:hypothetical protein [Gammaproteobacteria bacterium]
MRKILAATGAVLWLAAGSAVAAQDAALGLGAPVNMGRVVNSGAVDTEPTFSSDGSTMYFSCHDRRDPAGADICVSYRDADGAWTAPEIVGPPISSPEWREQEPLLSPDGTELYIMSDRPGGMGSVDIWVSEWEGNGWGELRNLGAPINSEFADHCLYFAGPDWEIAYWTSTRPGGYGGNDIWMSERVDGEWQEPVNLGPLVNSEASDHHSLPSADGNSLYITSNREGGYGLEDIYVTTRNAAGEWGPLVNLGPLVNTETNDRCPAFSPDYTRFYWDTERAGGAGAKDLWWIATESLPGAS